jgi:two-component system chemotaxis response regulator CheB
MPIRVLVVDDSAFARKVLREILLTSPLIEVVGIARDGLEALERIAELKPDVITLDLVMPHLDGVGLLQALPAEGAPRVVVVSISDGDSELGVAALQAGAFELVQKPTSLATERLYEMATELVSKVVAAAKSRVPDALSPPSAPSMRAARRVPSHRMVVIGTSTGGPQALTRLMREIPGDFPLPIAIVLHIPPGYTEALARRLDGVSALEVREAAEGMTLAPGRAVLARAGIHLSLAHGRAGSCVAHLESEPSSSLHRPSVDALFSSAAAHFDGQVLGVVLTGMGSDGLVGARAIRAAGGTILAEAASSCVVYGMPRSVVEAGLVALQVPLDRMAEAIVKYS